MRQLNYTLLTENYAEENIMERMIDIRNDILWCGKKLKSLWRKKIPLRAVALLLAVNMLLIMLPIAMFRNVYAHELICEQSEHTHSDGCYQLVCGIINEGNVSGGDVDLHTHSEQCYALVCALAEHKHSEGCYQHEDRASNPDLNNDFSKSDIVVSDSDIEGIPVVSESDFALLTLNNSSADAYVASFSVKSIVDGTAPFDSNNNAGNDANASNGIVRTFDSVRYNLAYSVAAYDPEQTYDSCTVCLRAVLPYDEQKASFNTDAMPWMDSGWAVTEETIDGVVCQVLTASRTGSEVPGTGDLYVVVDVDIAANGDKIQPTFYLSLASDEDNALALVPNELTVSAYPRYNVQIQKSNLPCGNVKGVFDFSTGNEWATNKSFGEITGSIYCYGITLQLYNLDKNKDLKGIEIPSGDITFNIEVNSLFTATNGNTTDTSQSFMPLVWSGEGHHHDNKIQKDGRNVLDYTSADYAIYAAPYNDDKSINSSALHQCYDGGEWVVDQDGNRISITVSSFRFEKDTFPIANAEVKSNTYYSENGKVENIGCFSAAELWIVQPHEDLNTGVSGMEYFENNGKISTTLTVKDFKATSISGQFLDRQTVISDDSVTSSRSLYQAPGAQNRITYSFYENRLGDEFGVDKMFWQYSYSDGTDWATLGQKIGLLGGVAYNDNGEPDNLLMGFDSLVKFDGSAIEVIPNYYTNHNSALKKDPNVTTKLVFATKIDGSNWENESEQMSASFSDLQYYETLSDIPSGYNCIAVLIECRGPINTSKYFARPVVCFDAKVKEDASLVGNTVILHEVSNLWTASDLRKANMIEVPSILDGKSYPDCSFTRTANYNKETYNEDGPIGTHTGEYTHGDTLYIVDSYTEIDKIVEQTENGEQKYIYNLDNGQRIVDYALNCSVVKGITDVKTTDVRVVDTLSAGQSYILGTGVVGGTYQPSAKEGYAGTVSGGTAIEPESIVKNSDGTTTLTWRVYGAAVGEDFAIHYACELGTVDNESTDIANNTVLSSTARITATNDWRDAQTYYKNLDSVEIKVSKLNALSFAKSAVNPICETNSEISYTAYMGNNSASTINDCVLLDTMPYDGFEGSYSVSKWEIDDSDLTNLSEFKLYYTTSSAASGTIASDYSVSSIRNGSSTVNGEKVEWKQATISSSTGVADLSDAGQITAWALIGDLKAAESLTVTLSILPNGNSGGDKYINIISSDAAYGQATVSIVNRVVKGVVWEDTNANGIRDEDEPRLSGVKVTLTQTKRRSASSLTCITDANGEYSFSGIAAGNYSLTFESDKVNLGFYTVTTKDNGSDATDNDAEAINDTNSLLQSAIISGISLPDVDSLNSAQYTSGNNDLGLVRRKVTITYAWIDDKAPDEAELPDCATISAGTAYTADVPDEKVIDSYEFSGWYTDSEGTAKFADGTVVDSDITLYGKWTKQTPSGGTSDDGETPDTGDHGNTTTSVSLAIDLMLLSALCIYLCTRKDAKSKFDFLFEK